MASESDLALFFQNKSRLVNFASVNHEQDKEIDDKEIDDETKDKEIDDESTT